MLYAGSGFAQSSNDERFRNLDLNRDGSVSLAEAAGNEDIVTKFDKADRNRDGRLSRAEYDRLDKVKVKPTRLAAAKAKAKDKRSAAAGGTR